MENVFLRNRRRFAVSGEGRDSVIMTPKDLPSLRLDVYKTEKNLSDEVMQMAKMILKQTLAAKDASPNLISRIIESFVNYRVPKSLEIVGLDENDFFFFVESGECQVLAAPTVSGKVHRVVRDLRVGKAYGDIALMHPHCPDEIVVSATADCSIWGLSRSVFQASLIATRRDERVLLESTLNSISFIKDILSKETINTLVDCFVEKSFSSGSVILSPETRSRGLGVVMSGCVVAFEGLSALPTETFRVGDKFQSVSLLKGRTLSQCFMARGEAHCAFLDRACLKRILSKKDFAKMRSLAGISSDSLFRVSRNVIRSIKLKAKKIRRRSDTASPSSATVIHSPEKPRAQPILRKTQRYAPDSGVDPRAAMVPSGRRVRFKLSPRGVVEEEVESESESESESEDEATEDERSDACDEVEMEGPSTTAYPSETKLVGLLDDPVLHLDSPLTPLPAISNLPQGQTTPVKSVGGLRYLPSPIVTDEPSCSPKISPGGNPTGLLPSPSLSPLRINTLAVENRLSNVPGNFLPANPTYTAYPASTTAPQTPPTKPSRRVWSAKGIMERLRVRPKVDAGALEVPAGIKDCIFESQKSPVVRMKSSSICVDVAFVPTGSLLQNRKVVVANRSLLSPIR